MKTLLVTLIAGIFTFSPVETPNNTIETVSEIKAKKNDHAKEWATIQTSILNNDAKSLGAFAGSDKLDSQALIKDAAAHSFVTDALKSMKFADLMSMKLADGTTYVLFEARKVIDKKDSKKDQVFKLHMSISEDGGQLTIDFYTPVKA